MSKVTHLTVEEGGGQNKRRIHLREISGDADAPLETVGQDLRAARLRRGDDLASVSKALKIRKDHLEALEEDRIENLPGRTYAIGFVRTYAEYLGLDAGQSVERFKTQIAGRTEEPSPAITVIEDEENRRLPQGWKIIVAFVLLLVAYGAYYLLVPTVDKTLQPPPVASVPGAPKKVVRIAPPPKPHPAPAASATTAPPPAAPPATADQQQQQPAPLPPGKVYGQQNHSARVVLRVLQATRVLVQGPDTKPFINRTLNPGDSYMVPDMVGLTLTTDNAGAIEIDLDGAPMGNAGRKGQIAESLSLDPQAIADRASNRR